jgi:hypothetical protein
MIEEALRRFCESPKRWLIVTAVTFVVGLALVLPLVDVYCAERDEKEAVLAELELARQAASDLERFEQRVDGRLTELRVLESRTVDEEEVPEFRGRLVDMVREAGCSLRRLNVGTASTRPWHEGDDPVFPRTDTKRSDDDKSGDGDTDLNLQWRPVTISLSGSITALQGFLQRLDAARMLMHTKTFEMYPSSPSRQTLTLDMELWYFTLTRGS